MPAFVFLIIAATAITLACLIAYHLGYQRGHLNGVCKVIDRVEQILYSQD